MKRLTKHHSGSLLTAWLLSFVACSSGGESNLGESDHLRQLALLKIIQVIQSEVPAGVLGRGYCVSALDHLRHPISRTEDPSDALVAALDREVGTVRKASKCHVDPSTGEVQGAGLLKRGHLIWAVDLKRITDSQIDITAGYWVASLDAADYTCRLTRSPEGWTLESCKLSLISSSYLFRSELLAALRPNKRLHLTRAPFMVFALDCL